MDLKKSIKDYSSSLGLDAIGFCKCRVFDELKPFYEERRNKGLENEFEEKDIAKRINPFYYMEEGKTIISVAFPYLFSTDAQDESYFSVYTLGNDYHSVVKEYLKRICSYIENLGGKAMYFVDSNSLPERYIAYLSGIGFIGKNNMIITEKYGSYVFLGEIITDLEIEADNPIQSKCGDCTCCIKECPTKSINKAGNCPNVCLSYITQKKEIEDIWFEKFKGRMFGCDSCQTVCPHNKNVNLSNLLEFEPYSFMKNISLKELVNIDNNSFKEKYSKTSCGWRGKNVLQRNAIINAAYKGGLLGIDIGSIKSPYVLDYYHRLLKALQL
jgi:epoxyqueuosine reductase